jgi:RimJ/RimL family protein N-acetyltransferase
MSIEKNRIDPIKIRNLKIDDFGTVLKWSKDDAFCLANGWEQNRSEAELYRWWIRCVTNEAIDFVRKGILLEEKLVGYVDLAFIRDSRAEVGIAIGESKLWGKGIGAKAVQCIMKYASEELGVTTFDAEIHEANLRSRKMFEKIGFKEMSRIGTEEYLGIDDQLIQYRFQ